MRSLSSLMMGMRDEAQAAAKQALEAAPEDPTSHAVQGWNYVHASNPRAALEHFRQALRL